MFKKLKDKRNNQQEINAKKKMEKELIRAFQSFTKDIKKELKELQLSPQLLNAIDISKEYRRVCSEIGKDRDKYNGLLGFLSAVREGDREIESMISFFKRKFDYDNPEKFRVEGKISVKHIKLIKGRLDSIQEEINEDLKEKKISELQKEEEKIKIKYSGKKSNNNNKNDSNFLVFPKSIVLISSKAIPTEYQDRIELIKDFRQKHSSELKTKFSRNLSFKEENKILKRNIEDINDILYNFERIAYYNHIKTYGQEWLKYLEKLGKEIEKEDYNNEIKIALRTELRNNYIFLDEWLSRVDLKYEKGRNINLNEGKIKEEELNTFLSSYNSHRKEYIKNIEDRAILKYILEEEKKSLKERKKTEKSKKQIIEEERKKNQAEIEEKKNQAEKEKKKNQAEIEEKKNQAEIEEKKKQAEKEKKKNQAEKEKKKNQAEIEEKKNQAEIEEKKNQAEIEEKKKQAEKEKKKNQAEIEEKKKQAEIEEKKKQAEIEEKKKQAEIKEKKKRAEQKEKISPEMEKKRLDRIKKDKEEAERIKHMNKNEELRLKIENENIEIKRQDELEILSIEYNNKRDSIKNNESLVKSEKAKQLLKLSKWRAEREVEILTIGTGTDSKIDEIEKISQEETRKNESEQAEMDAKANKSKPRLSALKSNEIDQIWEFYFLHQYKHPTPDEFYGGDKAKKYIIQMFQQIQEIYKNYKSKSVLIEEFPGNTTFYYVGNSTFSDNDKLLSRFFQPKIFESQANEDSLRIIYLGNYIGNSPMDLHNLLYLISFNLAYPKEVILLRGKNEELSQMKNSGFINNIISHFDQEVLDEIIEFFELLPLTHIAKSDYENVIAANGGIPINVDIPKKSLILKDLQFIPNIDNTHMDTFSKQFLYNKSNVDLKGSEIKKIDNMKGYFYGKTLFNRFMSNNQLSTHSQKGLLISSCDYTEEGVINIWNKRHISIFSIEHLDEKNAKAKIIEVILPEDPEYPEYDYSEEEEEEYIGGEDEEIQEKVEINILDIDNLRS